MNYQEIIAFLQAQGSWVNRDFQTRDHILFEAQQQTLHKVGVCWVMTKQVLKQAIEQEISFIITHENPFYQCSTKMMSAAIHSAEEKKRLLSEYSITVYRCHDVWDLIPQVGVSDQWAKRLGFTFDERKTTSYYQSANIPEMSVAQLAKHIANALSQDGEEGVYVFGDIHKKIHRIAIGTGAATNIYAMLPYQPDAVIVSEDGMQTYDAGQYAIDQNIPMIVVQHSCSEKAGIKAMVPYLSQHFPDIDVTYLDDGYHVSYFLGNS